MSTFSPTELITRVRDLTGYEAPSIETTELVTMANSSIRRLRIRLAKKDKSLFYDTDDSISVVSGTVSYSLPATCQKVWAVAVPDTSANSGYTKLRRFMIDDRYEDRIPASSTKLGTRYAIAGGKIWLHPIPTWADSLRLDIMKIHTTLAADDDYNPGIDGWDEWVVGDMCIYCATKRQDPVDGWLLMRSNAEELMNFAARFDFAEPRQVTRTGGHDRGGNAWRYGAG